MKVLYPPNTHNARILRFADGDTVVLLIQGLFGVWTTHTLRLLGIESYELDGPDRAKAQGIRDTLNEQLGNRGCLVHLRSHALDRYGRLRGRVTVGESDLATVLCEKGFAWAATREESIAKHMARRVAGVVALTATAGCTVIRDGSSYVMISGTNSVTGDISQKGQATLPTHPVAVAVVLIGVLAGLAALGWLIHNRGKLLGLAAKITTGV